MYLVWRPASVPRCGAVARIVLKQKHGRGMAGFHVITWEEWELLDRVAEVLTQRQIWLADNAWRSADERLRASEIELRELAKEPSWERLMRTRFFDDNGVYFHPLLFVRQGKKVNNFLIDDRQNYTRIWLRYHLPQTILKWDIVCVDVRRISENEALGLEVQNLKVIEQVDALVADSGLVPTV